MNKEEIRVKVKGGYIVSTRNEDPDWDGVSVYFETDDGVIIDIAIVECPALEDYKNINVYTYEDAYTEDYTRKYTLNTDEIDKILNQ